MPVFAVRYTYNDRAVERDEHRPAHRAFLRELFEDGRLMVAGAFADGPAGGLLIAQGDSAKVVAEILDHDPFQQHGLIENREIREWNQLFGPWAKEG